MQANCMREVKHAYDSNKLDLKQYFFMVLSFLYIFFYHRHMVTEIAKVG